MCIRARIPFTLFTRHVLYGVRTYYYYYHHHHFHQGANILVRYLGEEGAATPLSAAISMCNPFNLTISNANFEKGFNVIYDLNLAASLRRLFAQQWDVWRAAPPPFRPEVALKAKTIREFDDAITIHSFGACSRVHARACVAAAVQAPHSSLRLCACRVWVRPL